MSILGFTLLIINALVTLMSDSPSNIQSTLRLVFGLLISFGGAALIISARRKVSNPD